MNTTISWTPGPSATGIVEMPDALEVGDFLLVIVPVVSNGRMYREPSVVRVEEYGEPTLDGDPWGWSWADVSAWVKLDQSNLPTI